MPCIGPPIHGTIIRCSAEEMNAKASSEAGRHEVLEEDPDVTTLSRPETFECRGNALVGGRPHVGQRIEHPSVSVEVAREQSTRIAVEQWVEADVM